MAIIKFDREPTLKQLLRFTWVCLIGFPLTGLVLWWWLDMWTVPLVLWIAGPLVYLIGRISPAAVKPAYIGLLRMIFLIGFVFGHIVLWLSFYVLITGVGLIFRLMGRDAMTQKFDKAAKTYWISRVPVTNMERYFRQS